MSSNSAWSFFYDFHLVISLQMHRRREITFYSKLCLQLSIFLIVNHNYIGYAKPVDNVPPNEVVYFGLCDNYERFCLHPLGEIINNHNGVLSLCISRRWSSNYIYPHWAKGQWLVMDVSSSGGWRLATNIYKFLKTITLFVKLGCILS